MDWANVALAGMHWRSSTDAYETIVGELSFHVGAGLGGVHRGGERSMDVSADLIELGRTPVAVVCAGAKTVLDIPRTLEVLETQARRAQGISSVLVMKCETARETAHGTISLQRA